MKNEKLALWIGIVLLLLAVPTGLWPYSYYTFLRWVIAAIAIYLARSIWQKEYAKSKFWSYALVIVAIIFNPIAPLYMQKESWVPIDIVTALLFVVIGFLLPKENKK